MLRLAGALPCLRSQVTSAQNLTCHHVAVDLRFWVWLRFAQRHRLHLRSVSSLLHVFWRANPFMSPWSARHQGLK